MEDRFIHHIQKYISLRPGEIELLRQSFTMRKVMKKETIFKSGGSSHENYFVIDGCLRLYSEDLDFRERSIQFAVENWWMFDPAGIFQNEKSLFFIDAVEDTTLAVLTSQQWDMLTTRIPNIEKYFRTVFQRAYNA